MDIITDFKPGKDVLSLAAFLGNGEFGLDNPFEFIGTEQFSAAGQVRFENEILSLNVNGINING